MEKGADFMFAIQIFILGPNGDAESVRIGKCQNTIFHQNCLKLESVRTGKCQNWKVSELETVAMRAFSIFFFCKLKKKTFENLPVAESQVYERIFDIFCK
jgi:hypothetical protein